MARYVDGYVLPVPKRNVDAHCRIARKAGRIWREHGALEFRECVADDLNVTMGVPVRGRPPRGRRVTLRVAPFRRHRDGDARRVPRDRAPRAACLHRVMGGGDWPETINTLVLSEKNGRTTITLTILYPSKAARDAALGTGMKEGVPLSFDRLAALLASAGARWMARKAGEG